MKEIIIGLLPSADLRANIKATNHSFRENELLQMLYRYAPNYETRLAYLEQFALTASADGAALARAYIAYEKRKWQEFSEPSAGFVYELCIKETPDAYEEKYLCDSYSSALACIDRFYEEYADVGAKETEQTLYRVLKRKVFTLGQDFGEDTYGECVLGQHKILLEVVDCHETADCEEDAFCSECQKICPYRCDDVLYPTIADNYALLQYTDCQGKKRFGINFALENCQALGNAYCVVPLDAPSIRERRFSDGLSNHEHIAYPLATLATADDLDEYTRELYFAYLDFLQSKSERIE